MQTQDSKGTILYIGGFELPDKNAAAHRVLSNAKALREIGYETVFIGVSKEIASDVELISTQAKYEEFKAYAIPYPRSISEWKRYLTDASRYIELANTIEHLKAIICYNFQSVVLNKIRKYCKREGLRCIADVTEWYSGSGRSLPVRILKAADTFYRKRVVQKKLDGLIVISRFLENYYGECKNVIYIPPLTDFRQKMKPSEKPTKLSTPLRLIYAGSPGLKDRIDLLIMALSQVKRNVHLDIVGITKEEYLKLHPEHKTGKYLRPDIMFHGRLSYNKTLEFVRQADFSCFFREHNRVSEAGFPTKFVEAISLGTPVITNKSSNIEDYLQDNANGILLESLSINKIAKAIDNAKMPAIVENEIFEYHHYLPEFEKLIERLEKKI